MRKDSVSPDNLVMRIAGYSAFDFSKNAAVKKVTETEEECRQAFTTHQAKHHLNFMRQLSGFVIDPYHPFSEVSPDGIISCDCCRKVVSEIKCPITHRNISVEEAAKIDRDFCPDETLFCFSLDEQFFSVLVDKCEKIIKDHVMKVIITRQLEEQPTCIHQTTITSLRAFDVENKTRMIRPFYLCKNEVVILKKRS